MRRFSPLKKLNQHGFDHVLTGLAFAVIIALGGTYYLVATHANSWSGSLQLGLDKSLCMENMGNSNAAQATVDLNTCNTASAAQHWSIRQVGDGSNFQIVAAASGACIADTKGLVGTSGGNRVYLQTMPCNSNDHTQVWQWGGTDNHQLMNAYSTTGCINDPASSKTPGTRLVVFSCSSTSGGDGLSAAEWFEGLNSAASAPGTSSSTTAPPLSNTGEITSSAGSNLCVTAGTPITLLTCANSADQQWGQVQNASESSTEQFYNAAAKTYLGVQGVSTSALAYDTAASGNALWTANDTGSGTNSLQLLTAGSGNLDYCLRAAGPVLQLAACNGGADQSFTLPSPYTASGSSGSSATSTPASNSSDTTGADVTALLQALKGSKHPFACDQLMSTSDVSECKSVLGR